MTTIQAYVVRALSEDNDPDFLSEVEDTEVFSDVEFSDAEDEDDEFERYVYDRYFKKDQQGLSSYEHDILYGSIICHDHSFNLRPMETRFRRQSKDLRDHGLDKHRDSKTSKRIKKRLTVITSNPSHPQNEACVCVQIPKHSAKRIMHKQDRVKLRQSISHIHSLNDVPVIEKTPLDKDPDRIKIVCEEYEVVCPACGGTGYNSDSDYESYSDDDGYNSDCGRFGGWSSRNYYRYCHRNECSCDDGYITNWVEREIVLPPHGDRAKKYPYISERTRE